MDKPTRALRAVAMSPRSSRAIASGQAPSADPTSRSSKTAIYTRSLRRAAAAAAVGIAIELAGRPAAADTLAPEVASIVVDTQPRGDVIVLADARDVWVPASLLCEARLCRPGGIERDGIRYLDLVALAPDVSFRFDPETGELAVHIAKSALAPTMIELATRPPVGITYASAPSAFVNYALAGTLRDDGGPAAHVSGFAEAGLSLAGAVAYTTVAVPDADRVVRGLSRVSVESRAKLARVELGEDIVSGGLLGGGGVIAGLHVQRDLGIDPYFIARPTLTSTGEVATPSTIEVYRDGQLVRREVIPAGPYKISDLTGPVSGDTHVVVRDVFGLTQATITTLGAPPPRALAPGLHDFSYSIGALRTNLATASFDYGAPAALAVHRVGLARWLTVGARAEATPERGSAGVEAVVYAGRFSVQATAATSAARRDRAAAAAAFDLGWHRAAWTLSARVRTTGARYATLDLAPSDDRALLDAGAGASWAASRRVTASGEIALEERRDVGTRAHASASATIQLSPRAHVLATAVLGDTAGTYTFEATASLALSLDARTTAIATVAAGAAAAGGTNLTASIDHALSGVRGIGYDAEVRVSDTTQADARVLAQGDYGRVEATTTWTQTGGRGDVAIAGGLVAIGGEVHAVRPVHGAFALVRVPGAPGARVTRDNQVVARLDARGSAIVPELQPNYGNHLAIDIRDIPVSLAMRDLERIIAPPRLGGAIVQLVAARAATVRGTLAATAAGQPIDASFGELIIDPGPRELRAPIGRHGLFEIEAIAVGAHRMRVEIDGAACERPLVIHAPGEIALGVVSCALGAAP